MIGKLVLCTSETDFSFSLINFEVVRGPSKNQCLSHKQIATLSCIQLIAVIVLWVRQKLAEY